VSTTRGWVRRFHPAAENADRTVVVFPHAGGGASAYRLLSAALAEQGTETLVIQYPGRQDRAAEPHPGTLPGLAQGAVDDLLPLLTERPITLFGHSMGAIVAFEAARILQATGRRVERLVPSAAVPPSQVEDLPSHPTRDDELLARAAMLDGSDPAVLADNVIARLALPAMRADFAAFDAYTCAAGVTVDAPVTALGGLDDPAVPPAHLHGWAGHSTVGAQVRLLPGGHFFWGDHIPTVAQLLTPARARA
jgi:surfactin synthase thioesterase subunit